MLRADRLILPFFGANFVQPVKPVRIVSGL